MKNIFLLLLLVPFLSYSQDEEESVDCDYEIEKVNDSTYKTTIINFDALSSAETCFLGWMNSGKDKPNGILLVYDQNGKKRRKAIYKGGIRVGTHLQWYATGELEDETTWETDSTFYGKGYYPSGKLKHTSVNGNRENALYIDYYENGQKASVMDWSNDGDKEWYANGKPKLERNTKTNEYKEWYENGQLKVDGQLSYGWGRKGTWSYYNEKGKLLKELFYEDSEHNTTWFGEEEGFKTQKKY